jgi:hypothetical protein
MVVFHQTFKMISYTDFTTAFPVYGALPYTQAEIEMKLSEVADLFPQIYDCIPAAKQLTATKYGLGYLYDLESAQCQSGYAVAAIKSMTDSVQYNILKGRPDALSGTMHGGLLLRMFKTNGCYLTVGQRIQRCQGGCGCDGSFGRGGGCGCHLGV